MATIQTFDNLEENLVVRNKINNSLISLNNEKADLDDNGKVPITQIPLGTTEDTVGRGDMTNDAYQHISVTGNPHGTTKDDIELGNVSNTSDLDKPISTATQTALNNKVDKISGKGLSTNDYTDSDKTRLANTSGTNTGDETASSIKTKLGISVLSGNNTGDQDLSGYVTKETGKYLYNDGMADSRIQVKKGVAGGLAEYDPFIYKNTLNDSYFDGLFSDTLSIQSMSQRTGTGTRTDGTVYTNPLTYKDTSGIRVKQIWGQTSKNIVQGGNFANGITGWGLNKIVSPTVANNELTFTASGQYAQVQGSVGSLILNHVYYVSGMMKSTYNGASIRINASGTILGGKYHSGSGNYERLSKVFTATVSVSTQFLWQDDTASNWAPISCKEGMLIDLTSVFGNGKEPTQAWCDANIVWFDGTVSIANSTVRSQNSDGSKYTDLIITGSLRSVLDNGTLYQDRLYNANGKWYIDRWVDPTTGNKLATMTTEVATVSGNLVAYKGGSIVILNSSIPPKCDLQYMENWGEWETYTPTLSWVTATPATNVVSSFKYSKINKRVRIQGYYKADDGNGATNVTITLPFVAKSYSGIQPMAVASQQKVNTTWSVPIGYIDDSTSLVKFRTYSVCTDNTGVELSFSGEYEMA